MSRFPVAGKKVHEAFRRNDMWSLVRNARGGVVRHHSTWELPLPDGRVLRTRISRPVDNTDYGPRLWAQILKDQLEVSEAQFWECVNNGTRPVRLPGTVEIPDKEPIPLGVVEKLVRLVGLGPVEIEKMTRDQAVARLNQYWSEQ